MEWDPPETTPVGEDLPAPVEQPDSPAEATVPPVEVQWPDHAIPVETTPLRVRPESTDDAYADFEDDAYRGRPRWVFVVAVVLIVTFVGWAIYTVTSRV